MSKRAEKDRDRYYWYKEHGICTKCGQRSSEPNRTMCWECLEKNREYNERRRKHNVDNARELRKKRREQGLCPFCGAKPSDGYVLCDMHRAKKMKRYYATRQLPGISRSEWPSYGMCYHCGKPLDTDKKLCKKCIEEAKSHLPKHNNTENHVWGKEEKNHYEQWKRRNQRQDSMDSGRSKSDDRHRNQ